MSIWQARFISFDGAANYTANLTLDDQGDGRVTGTLRHWRANPIEEIDLAGVVHNNHFTVKGSASPDVEVELELTFTPSSSH